MVGGKEQNTSSGRDPKEKLRRSARLAAKANLVHDEPDGQGAAVDKEEDAKNYGKKQTSRLERYYRA